MGEHRSSIDCAPSHTKSMRPAHWLALIEINEQPLDPKITSTVCIVSEIDEIAYARLNFSSVEIENLFLDDVLHLATFSTTTPADIQSCLHFCFSSHIEQTDDDFLTLATCNNIMRMTKKNVVISTARIILYFIFSWVPWGTFSAFFEFSSRLSAQLRCDGLRQNEIKKKVYNIFRFNNIHA